MGFRRFLVALAAFTMLWAPVALQNGSAMATAPSDHSEQMIESGHCDEGKKADDEGSDATGQSCCAAMCMAIEAFLVAPVEPQELVGVLGLPSISADGPSFLADFPTPPPRTA